MQLTKVCMKKTQLISELKGSFQSNFPHLHVAGITFCRVVFNKWSTEILPVIEEHPQTQNLILHICMEMQNKRKLILNI